MWIVRLWERLAEVVLEEFLKIQRDKWWGFFSKAMGELCAYEAEVKAILQGLIFCQQHQLKHILIESDSTLAVGWSSNQANRPWRLIQDLNLIDALSVEVDCIGIKHIYRESNSIADFLAKSGCHMESNLWSFLLKLWHKAVFNV